MIPIPELELPTQVIYTNSTPLNLDTLDMTIGHLIFWYNHTDTKLSARLSEDFTLFHRSSKPSFDHFTHEQKGFVNSVIRGVSQQLFTAFGSTYNVDEYITT